MIRDRGRIKWTAMMLPEHVKLLRDWAREDGYEQKRELDEQKLDSMNELIIEAIELKKSLAITHYRQKNYELLVGNIHSWDEITQRLHVIDRFGEIHRIDIVNVADVQFTD